MTKNELKQGFKVIETMPGKVNVLIKVTGTFEGRPNHLKAEFIVWFDQKPTSDIVRDWVREHYSNILTRPDWTDIIFTYSIVDSSLYDVTYYAV